MYPLTFFPAFRLIRKAAALEESRNNLSQQLTTTRNNLRNKSIEVVELNREVEELSDLIQQESFRTTSLIKALNDELVVVRKRLDAAQTREMNLTVKMEQISHELQQTKDDNTSHLRSSSGSTTDLLDQAGADGPGAELSATTRLLNSLTCESLSEGQ